METVTTAADDSRRRQNRWGEGNLLRDEIIDAARRLLERAGTEAAVTMRGVAREAGITAPSIYAHLRDRDELLEAVIIAAYTDLAQRRDLALANLPQDARAHDRLRAGAMALVDYAADFPASFQILWVRPNPSEMPYIGRVAMTDHENVLETIHEAAPHLTPDQVRARGQLFWASVHGLAILPPHHPRFPWVDRQTLVNDLVTLITDQEPALSLLSRHPDRDCALDHLDDAH